MEPSKYTSEYVKTDELLHCPQCGSTNVIMEKYQTICYIHCNDCHLMSNVPREPAAAVKHWNQRFTRKGIYEKRCPMCGSPNTKFKRLSSTRDGVILGSMRCINCKLIQSYAHPRPYEEAIKLWSARL